jgi:alkyl hydroperoxide reductase subunit AhpF
MSGTCPRCGGPLKEPRRFEVKQIGADLWTASVWLPGGVEPITALANEPHGKAKALLRLLQRLRRSQIETAEVQAAFDAIEPAQIPLTRPSHES